MTTFAGEFGIQTFTAERYASYVFVFSGAFFLAFPTFILCSSSCLCDVGVSTGAHEHGSYNVAGRMCASHQVELRYPVNDVEAPSSDWNVCVWLRHLARPFIILCLIPWEGGKSGLEAPVPVWSRGAAHTTISLFCPFLSGSELHGHLLSFGYSLSLVCSVSAVLLSRLFLASHTIQTARISQQQCCIETDSSHFRAIVLHRPYFRSTVLYGDRRLAFRSVYGILRIFPQSSVRKWRICTFQHVVRSTLGSILLSVPLARLVSAMKLSG